MVRSIPDAIDVLVAGAGPAGIGAARAAHEAGASVLLVDARLRIGHPVRCGELVRMGFFDALGFEPRPHWIRWTLEARNGMPVINRTAVESESARMLAERGVQVEEGCAVTSVGPYDGRGRWVELQSGGRTHRTHARYLVAADGAPSRVARMAGLSTALNPLEVAACVAYRIVETRLAYPDDFRFQAPPALSPHYFWVIPSGPDEANVGLGLPGHRGHVARNLLDRMCAETELFQGGRIAEVLVGWYPSALPLEEPWSDGLLVAGTAARLIDAELGEGLFPAAFSGRMAGETIAAAGGAGEARALAPYGERIRPLYPNLYRHYARRRARERGRG